MKKLETRLWRIIRKYEEDEDTCDHHRQDVIRTLKVLEAALEGAVSAAEDDYKSLRTNGNSTFPCSYAFGESAAQQFLRIEESS